MAVPLKILTSENPSEPEESMGSQRRLLIIDGKRVMFGSHNWSNEGVKTNRDASLVFDDEEIAQYLAEIYDYDWDNLATAHPAASRPRVAHSGDPTPAGMRRVSYSAVYDD